MVSGPPKGGGMRSVVSGGEKSLAEEEEEEVEEVEEVEEEEEADRFSASLTHSGPEPFCAHLCVGGILRTPNSIQPVY
ncbi:hypothetical protein AAFF_G00094120 [Aldrovandia affinis]|uniref:Uncharacterized protein n=1 Tax=Aldrovandia affinis TaxID=143900 RepID=A0AAD7T2Z9_9TELE|nr:hypothetical protein AAFF_G00094120 [Aldrovandia affinis]